MVRLLLFLLLAPCALGQKAQSFSGALRNERLKRLEFKDTAILGDDQLRTVSGMWVPDWEDNPAKALVFPEQVKITCTHSLKTCQELKVTLGQTKGIISVQDIDETIWQISSWDSRGLRAAHDPDPSTVPTSDRCHRRVLAMNFVSGAVSTSDIPTHEKGCEAFVETNSYRLAKGNYYVDTTPANDVDKPTK
jgi:hypothetical protein